MMVMVKRILKKIHKNDCKPVHHTRNKLSWLVLKVQPAVLSHGNLPFRQAASRELLKLSTFHVNIDFKLFSPPTIRINRHDRPESSPLWICWKCGCTQMRQLAHSFGCYLRIRQIILYIHRTATVNSFSSMKKNPNFMLQILVELQLQMPKNLDFYYRQWLIHITR